LKRWSISSSSEIKSPTSTVAKPVDKEPKAVVTDSGVGAVEEYGSGSEEGSEIVEVTQKLLDTITSGDYETYKLVSYVSWQKCVH
jgi:hypothetical protein